MPDYIVNKTPDENGYNIVHQESCRLLPPKKSRFSLGWQPGPEEAVKYANLLGLFADGCNHCCPSAHKM